MSILIKGIGMPNAHQVRPFYLKGNGDGTATFMSGRHLERGGLENIVKEATHVAAVAVQMIEALNRRADNGK